MGNAQCPSPRLGSDDELASVSVLHDDSSLGALVREWLTTSEAVDQRSRPEGDDASPRPTWTPPAEDELVVLGSLATSAAPALPRRRRQTAARATRRLAVLIDAEATPADSADDLFEALGDQGTVTVSRAYGDWSTPRTRQWWPAVLRQHAIQPHHQFGSALDQRALVALTIDAVDLARESAVDVVVIVGDLASLHPLVARLNESGIDVIACGTTPTPQDVRSLCHEFVDLTGDPGLDGDGRHRA